MLLSLCLIAVCLAFAATVESTSVPNLCPQPTASVPAPPSFYYGHPDSCNHYFTCAHGTPYKMTCPPGKVWSDDHVTCVHFNSEHDTCTRKNAKRECDRRRGQPLLIPHLKECHKYYNCSNTAVPSKFSILREYGEMCKYPQVFDVIDKKCKSFKEGNCGPGRIAAKEICNYRRSICGTSHCVPCNPWNLSCIGKTDGKHEFPQRIWTSYFIECDTERVVGVHTCTEFYPSSQNVMFSPIKRECVPRAEAPPKFGGLS